MAEHETQESICAWAEAAFGTGGSDMRVACRANEELAEALRAESAGKEDVHVAEEIADTLIVLCRLGRRIGMTLLFGDITDPDKAIHGAGKRLAFANYAMAGMIHHAAYAPKGEFALFHLQEVWRALHIVLWELGINPQLVVDAKMRINRKRVWKADGTGHGYHVRDKG